MSSAQFPAEWVFTQTMTWLVAHDEAVEDVNLRRREARARQVDRLMANRWFWMFPYVPKSQRTREYVENHLGPQTSTAWAPVFGSHQDTRLQRVRRISRLAELALEINVSEVTLTDEDVNTLLTLPKSGG